MLHYSAVATVNNSAAHAVTVALPPPPFRNGCAHDSTITSDDAAMLKVVCRKIMADIGLLETHQILVIAYWSKRVALSLKQ